MNCENVRDLHELFRDGALDGAAEAGVRAHLDACAACREFEAEAAADLSPLRGFPPGPYLPPSPPPSFHLPPWAGGPGGALLLSAALLVAGAAAWMALGGTPPAAPPETAAAPSPAPSDAVSARTSSGATTGVDASPAVPSGPPARLLGRLVLPDGSSLPGARVTVGSCTTETDAGGLFRFDDLPPGLSRPALVEPKGLPAFRMLLPPLPAGTTTELAPMETGPACGIQFLVLATDANPVEGASVEAFRVPGIVSPPGLPTFPVEPGFAGIPVESATTDQRGIARFPGLPAGSWSFQSRKAGFAPSRPMEASLEAGGPSSRTILLETACPLEGVVLDEESREPIADAEVAWIGAGKMGSLGDVRLTGWTRADGRGGFRVPDLPPGAVLLCGRRPGSSVFAGPVLVEAGRVHRAVLALPPDGDLEGVVLVEGTGAPLPGAALGIHVEAPGPFGAKAVNEHYLLTGSDGGFRIPRGRTRGCSLFVRVFGSPLGAAPSVRAGPGSAWELPLPEGTVRIEVRPGGRAATGLPPSPPAHGVLARVRGSIVDPDGRPAAAARARCFPCDARTAASLALGPQVLRPYPADPVPVAADGTFAAELTIPPGAEPSVRVEGTAPGFAPGSALVGLDRGSAADSVRIVLRPGAAIRGTVVDADGRPVADLPVEASSQGADPLVPHALTGPDGSFAIDGLPETPVRLLLGWWHDVRHVAGPFVPGTEAIRIRLPATRDLEVLVRGRDGSPVRNQCVWWQCEDGSRRMMQRRTGDDGIARFPRAPVLPFRIRVGSGSDMVDTGDFVQAATGILPHDGSRVEIPVEAGKVISGMVALEDGSPAAGATVLAQFPGPDRPLSRSVRTSAEGAFTLRGLPAGTHRLRVFRLMQTVETEAEAGRRDVRIRLAAGTPSSDPASSVEGRVLDTAGNPQPGIQVSLHAEDGKGDSQHTRTGADGRFTLRGTRNARHLLVARDPKGLAAYADGVVGGARDVVLHPGSRGSGIGGRVARPDGAAAAGVPVVAIRLDAPGGAPAALDVSPGVFDFLESGLPGPGLARATATGGDGTFDLGSPPGRWAVFAGIPGKDVAPGAAAIRGEDDRSPLDLVTGEGWTLRARVSEEGEEPPPEARVEIRLEALLPDGVLPPFVRIPLPVGGAFEVPGLPAGPVSVVLQDAGGEERGRWRIAAPAPGDGILDLRVDR